jgi:hypothetical protein
MALVPDQKFSTFDNGGDLQVGDIIVGLRNGLNTRFNYTGQLPLGFIVPVSQGGTDANNVVDARTNLGLGTMATQNANNVNITGGVAALTSLTLATALAKSSGGTGVTSATTTPTANEFAAWDADSNLRANNFIERFATTATAGGTTTLTVSSAGIQEFTGTLTQTVVMPVTTTLIAGHQFVIINNSSGNLTINSSGGNLILTMAANTTAFITCVVASGTGAASWNASYVFDQGAGVLSITGTANQIAASSSMGNVTLSLPAALDFPGTFTVQNTVDIDEILDEDNMVSDSPTALATQQSIKAYVDNAVTNLGIITDWVAYTPTFQGFGSPSSIQVYSRRVGDTLQIRGRFTSGTTTGSQARMTLGYNGTNSNVTSSNTKITGIQRAGSFSFYTASILIQANVGYVTFSATTSIANSIVPLNGNALFNNGDVLTFMIEVPVDTWP